jgi:hypothetical protein
MAHIQERLELLSRFTGLDLDVAESGGDVDRRIVVGVSTITVPAGIE